MAKITTNFNTEKHFVLTNSESKIMAIIHVPPGNNDISEKIKRAILEDENAEIVNLLNEFVIIKEGANYMLKASIVFDDTSDAYENYYNLTAAAAY